MTQLKDTTVATFGAGCFWCIEAAFQQLKGVQQAISGYMGGHTINPDYSSVCRGDTGHAEVVRIHFDPSLISYQQLLDVWLFLHDPTQLNRQGNDVGSQYRSAIFYETQPQFDEAQAYLSQLKLSGQYNNPIVTTLEPASTFYVAEPYHQGYVVNNPYQPYCQFLVLPKLAKFRQQFVKLLAEESY